MFQGAPLPPYIKEQGGRPAGPCRRVGSRSPPPSRSRTPLFPTPTRRGKGRGRWRRKGGTPPLLVQFRPEGEGRAACPRPALSLSTKAHKAHYFSREGFGNPPALRFSPKLGTLPVSEYSRPIYRSLRLDHFETPRHVCDHIRDSDLPSVHQNTKTHNTDRHRTLSVRTLRVRELCRHDRDTSPVNNQ